MDRNIQNNEGVILPTRRPVGYTLLRGVAAGTVFAFTLTSILPSGYAAAQPQPRKDSLRGLSTKESPKVEAGLEDALTETEGREPSMSRRAFLRIGAGAVLSASTFVELLGQIADAEDRVISGKLPDPNAPASTKAEAFLYDRQVIQTLDTVQQMPQVGYGLAPVARRPRQAGLPVTYQVDRAGSRLLQEAILKEAKATGKPVEGVSQRYFKGLGYWGISHSTYAAATAAVAWISQAAREKDSNRKQGLLTNARWVLAALARLERKTGRIGYSSAFGAEGQPDDNLEMGTTAWVGEAFVLYQKLSGDTRPFEDGRTAVAIAEGLGRTVLEYQKKGIGDAQRMHTGTGLVPMGWREGKLVPWGSTEYNVDAFFFLRDLAALSGKPEFGGAADRIAAGIEKYLWDSEKKRFRRGFNDDEQVLDANSWGALFLLARGHADDARAVWDTIQSTFRREVAVEGVSESLLGYAPAPRDEFVWSEGSFGVVALARRLGEEEKAQEIEKSLTRIQVPLGGYRYAYPPAISSGSDGGLFSPYPDVASTAWSLIARSPLFWAAQAGLEEPPLPAVKPEKTIWEQRGAAEPPISLPPMEQGRKRSGLATAVAVGLVAGAALLGGAANPHAGPSSGDLPQGVTAGPTGPELLSTGTNPAQQPVLLQPFTPSLRVDAAAGELPTRVRPTPSSAPATEGLPLVGKIMVPAGKPDEAVATQTEVPRVLTSPAHFSREHKATTLDRLTQRMAGVRTWIRQAIYGTDDPRSWTASQTPERSLILPHQQTGFTVWNPERLEDLGPDRVEALFTSIGQEAGKQGRKPFILYEINWAVTLGRAQREEGPVNEAVLRKVRAHIELAHKHHLQVVALYSGTEALGDPAAAIQHLEIAIQMGFDQTMAVTDIEPWAVPADQPEGRWQRAMNEMQQAIAAGNAQMVSQARQKLLNEAVAWQFAHEEILRRVLPEDQAHPETLEGPPQVHAFVQPAFVPVLKMAGQWRVVRQIAESQGFNVNEAWKIFDSVTAPRETGKGWTEKDLAEQLAGAGLTIQETDLAVFLPARLKLVVMAYSYPDGQEAVAVAEQMKMAHAGGFGGELGLAVNLELGDPAISLGGRSERAGEILGKIVDELNRPGAKAGFDGRTVFVHVADELGLVDMTRDGRLSLPRQMTPKQMDRAIQGVHAAVGRAFGVPEKQVWEEHWIPKPETTQEFARRLAMARLWGLGGGVVGIGPWYALDQNLQNWIAYGLPAIHPDTGPSGAEAGGGLASSMVIFGALSSGQAQVTDMHLRLIKRDPDGRMIREEVVRHVPGRNSPIISEDIWDEVELEVTVRRMTPRWGPKLIVDMAAKVENRDVATIASPREAWSNTSLLPGQMESTFTVKLPELMAGSNNFLLLTHDNQGRIMQWIGSGQNTRYLTPYAPFVAEGAVDRLKGAQKDLKALRVQLGKQPGQMITRQELVDVGRHDLIADQQALALNPLSVRTGHRAHGMVWFELNDLFDMNQADPLLEEIKLRGVDSMVVRIPDLEKEARAALARSDRGLDPFTAGGFQGGAFPRLIRFIQRAHRHGLLVRLVLSTPELVRQAQDVQMDEVGKAKSRSQADIVGDLLKLVLLASDKGKWDIDTVAFDQPTPDPQQRALLERIVRVGLNTPMIVIGPNGVSSKRSLYVRKVPLQADPQAVLDQVDQILAQPQPEVPERERFGRAVVLQGGSLTEVRDWLRGLPTVISDPTPSWAGMTELTNRLRTPHAETLNNRLGYGPTLIAEVLRRAPTVSQQELSDALGLDDPDKEPEPWARAMVDAKAEELKAVSEVPQVERYGSSYDNALLNLYGIQLTPLILTEAQRAEVTPLTSLHVQQKNGTALLGVQVTNPADPKVVKGPAVYDVHVHADYPIWTGRPKAVHKFFRMILKPGETAPAWIELTGLPQDENSRAVRVRVLPRGAEEHRPGQIGTRPTPEQALESASFVLEGQGARTGDPQDQINEELSVFMERWSNWTEVYGLKPGDAGYADHFDRQLKAFFGVGTPAERAVVTITRDPNSEEVTGGNVGPLPNPVAAGARQAAEARKKIDQWQTEMLTRVQEQPPTLGRRLMTWFYWGAARVALVGVAVAYVIGMLRSYRRSAQVHHYLQSRRKAAVRLAADGSALPPPTGAITQTVSVADEKIIQVAGPLGANFSSRPALLHPGQQQPGMALTAYNMDRVIVLDDPTQEMSENIRRTLVDPLGSRRPGQPPVPPEVKSQAERALFQRTVPTLMGLNVVGVLGALLLGTPAVWVFLGTMTSAALWVSMARSRKAQERLGYALATPARWASSPGLNHPLALAGLGALAVAGAWSLVTVLGVPLGAAAIVAGVWWGVSVFFAQPEWSRIPGAFGITGVGAAILLWLPAATLPVWGWVALSVATILITQRILTRWMDTDLPVEGLLREGWGTFRFMVKASLFAAAVYGIFAVAHPFLWTGLKAWLTLPVLGSGVLTVGSLIVGSVLLLNLGWQGVLLTNWWNSRAAPRRDWWNFTLLGLVVPALILGSFLLWPASAAAVWVTIWVWVALAHGAAWGLRRLEAGFNRVRNLFGQDRLAPDERVLVYENNPKPTPQDLQDWLAAWQFAYEDKDQHRRQGIKGFPSTPVQPPAGLTAEWVAGELKRLTPAQRRLINLHAWRLRSIQKAQAQQNFSGLSPEDQGRLVRHYFTEFQMAHLDTVISGDLSGTLLRTFGYGWWTATMEEFIRRMRNDDQVVVIMPALLLSIVWAPGDVDDPWGRIKKGQIWLVGWELFRMLLASVTAPLGFFASMENRNLRSMFTQDSNTLAAMELRADAGIEGYREPITYVIHVMGRWLVGHRFVLMRAYPGRRVTRNADDLLLTHRWERKDGSVREHIERLRREAKEARAQGDRDLFLRKMAAARYAALTGGKNITFDLGETPPPGPPQERRFTRAGDADAKTGVDPKTDDTRMPPELERGALAGTVGMRLSEPEFHFPIRVEWNPVTQSGTLSPDPGRINFKMTHKTVKARGADTGFQILQGRFTPEAEIVPIPKKDQKEGGPTHELKVRIRSEEDEAFPEIQSARETVDHPRDRYKGIRRDKGVKAAHSMAVQRHERILGAPLGSDEDATSIFEGELGYEGYKDPAGLWYQLRLNFFGWLRARYLGHDKSGKPNAWRAALWWAGALAVAAVTAWGIGSVALFLGLVAVPWLITILLGTLIPISFIGLGIQSAILQGMKAHYDGAFLKKGMDEFFQASPAEDRSGVQAVDYLARLERGWKLIQNDPKLQGLVELYPRLMHPEHPLYRRLSSLSLFGMELWPQQADPAVVEIVRTLLKDPKVPTDRWALRRLVKQEILKRVEQQAGKDADPWLAFREAFTRNTQFELAAIGDKVTGISGNRSRDPDVFRGGDVNRQFGVEGQEPLENLMKGLGVTTEPRLRSWAYVSKGAFYDGVRMPSMMYGATHDREIQAVLDRARPKGFVVEAVWKEAGKPRVVIRYEGDVGSEDGKKFLSDASKTLKVDVNDVILTRLGELDRVKIPPEAVRRIAPLQAYLNALKDNKNPGTANQFMLEHTHLQPDLEAVNEFLQEESLEVIRHLDLDGITVARADQALAERGRRLGRPQGEFVRFADLKWDDAKLQQKLRDLQAQVKRDGGDVHLSAARQLPKWVTRRLAWARWWAIAIGIAGGFFFPPLFGMVLAAWILGLSPVRTGFTSLSRWVQPQVWGKALWSWKEPYSDEVILLSLLYGVHKDQVVRGFNGEVVDLKWSVLDGLYDGSRWRLALGTYLFPGTPVARLQLWERGGAMIHAPPVPFLAALRLLEEPPWLASASGFNRLPTDAFEIGGFFAEDTLFGLINLHRPSLNPTVNALNVHKLDYLLGQQELRKRDQATPRAIQLLKGVGMAEAIEHLLDHPMLGNYRARKAGKAVQRLFGWDPEAHRPSDQSIFGMEAFRRDEVATRGAGTLSYGYSGYTASDLFGRRVGPFAPGDVAAYWEYRTYQELNRRLLENPQGSPGFFETMRAIQRTDQPDLNTSFLPADLLQGQPVDPWAVMAYREALAEWNSLEPKDSPAAGLEESNPKRFGDVAVGDEALLEQAAETAPSALRLKETLQVQPIASATRLQSPGTFTSVQETRVAVISARAAKGTVLEELAGQPRQIGKGWLWVLPPQATAETLSEWVAPFMEVPNVVLMPFGEPGDFALVKAMVGDLVSFQEPQLLRGTTLLEILRQIIANLAGLKEDAVSESELAGALETLGLGVEA